MVVQHTYGLTVVISAGPGMYPVKRYGDDLGREKTKIIAARFHKFYIFFWVEISWDDQFFLGGMG